ncbi:hypothetical protein MesoLjLc_75030 [Mesorhizobium sp. L-8-10]|uniref:protein kinase domain-containing protein n=1 Tax=Mesorhizobium sp. L-8-10 TaxID=2744523 RepID=UPI0019256B0E|nr:protein kinase [Mesorhizobium sp. L-8-10]BCH35573.1 hypothetical protein MesoLjLc_75030 [Mesorhizobium sp. L-8-10]
MAGPCPYELVGPLRAGSIVSVHEAVDGATSVVVKILDEAAAATDPVSARRFAREIALNVGARHPGLATVHGHGQNWIAFERLEPPGDRWTRPGGLRRLVAQLAAVLAYLHARGIVHRDVKPAHVMFRGEQPALIDLGVAGLIADDPLDGKEMVGSPAWMAPEQLHGAKPAPSADIWSLCAVGVSIAQGAPLFCGTADAVLAERRRTVRPEVRLAGLLDDRCLVRLLEAGLGPAGDRPTAAEMARELLLSEE